MRKSLFVISLLALAIAGAGVSAQAQINFADLPLVATPTPMPGGYAGLNWTNFMYVDPSQYTLAGAGFSNLFTHRDVAFIGGLLCGPVMSGCYGVIAAPGGPTAFVPVSILMSAGYRANQVKFLAYNQGTYVGSLTVPIATSPRLVRFPASWGAVTELQVRTDTVGDLVLFDLEVLRVGG